MCLVSSSNHKDQIVRDVLIQQGRVLCFCPHLFRGISDSFDWQFMKIRKLTFTSFFRTCETIERAERHGLEIRCGRGPTEPRLTKWFEPTNRRGASFCASLVTGSTTATTSKYMSPSLGRIFTALQKKSANRRSSRANSFSTSSRLPAEDATTCR